MGSKNWLSLVEEVGEGGWVGSLEMQETWSWAGPAEMQEASSMGGAPIHPLHKHTYWDGRCSWLTHLDRLSIGLGLWGNDWLRRPLWHCGRLGLCVCGGSWRMFRAGCERWLAGLWVRSGAVDVLLNRADGECRSVVQQHPLYKRVKYTEQAVRIVGEAYQI